MMMGDNTNFLDSIDVKIHVDELVRLDSDINVNDQIISAEIDLEHDLARITVPEEILQPLLEILQPNRYQRNPSECPDQVNEVSSSGDIPHYINPLRCFSATKYFVLPGDPPSYFNLQREYEFKKSYSDINADCGMILIAKRLAKQYIYEGKDAKALIKSIAEKLTKYKIRHGL